MNETLKVIANRYSCREFSDKAVESDILKQIAEAGIQSPSGVNRQNWQIIVVKNKSLIKELEAEGMKNLAAMPDPGMYNRIMSRGGKLFYNAQALVIIAIKPATPPGAELIDLGIVAENIVLAATSLGVDNVHCGLAALSFAGARRDEFKSRLKFPERYEIGMGILLGYAVKKGVPHAPDINKITFIE